MGNINKKVDKIIAKRQWDKLLHNLGETNGDSKMKIAKACGVSGGSGCIDLLSVILNDREVHHAPAVLPGECGPVEDAHDLRSGFFCTENQGSGC